MTTSPDDHAAPPKSGIPLPPLRACLAGLGLNSCSSLTVTPVFELRRVAVRMHRSTIINQLKSCEARLNAVIFIGGRLRKRSSAKQALNQHRGPAAWAWRACWANERPTCRIGADAELGGLTPPCSGAGVRH